ncbi:TetR/AcrR family transcriptional regulator [Chromatiaceae bacterium AAb-1]|nr:TetR/AcrR family transcriptional regulator [Chromatiaceae bacterium AAb-1]
MNKSTASVCTRERLINAMSDTLQCKGFHAAGLSSLLEKAQTPKGGLYHHFPQGKTALAIAAIENSVARISAQLEYLQQQQPEPIMVLQLWLAEAEKRLEQSQFERGCPLATAALESTAEDIALRQALANGFGQLRQSLARLLDQAGIASERAQQLATLSVSAYEGALMQARVAGNSIMLRDTTRLLLELISRELPAQDTTV